MPVTFLNIPKASFTGSTGPSAKYQCPATVTEGMTMCHGKEVMAAALQACKDLGLCPQVILFQVHDFSMASDGYLGLPWIDYSATHRVSNVLRFCSSRLHCSLIELTGKAYAFYTNFAALLWIQDIDHLAILSAISPVLQGILLEIEICLHLLHLLRECT